MLHSKHTTPRHVAQALGTETLSDEPNPPPKNKSWGYHLLVDCSSCNDKIDDEKCIEDFIDLLVNELDMKKLSPLTLERVDGEDGRGISAMQMITTSHLACHFDDDKRSGYIDVFSCKEFKPETALKTIEEYFQPKRMAHQFVYRDAGLKR